MVSRRGPEFFRPGGKTMKTAQIFSQIKRLWRRDEGTATAELVILTPVFLVLFGMVTDASFVFGRQAEILRVIQDANRSLAVGRFLTEVQAETYVTDEISHLSDETTVAVNVVGGIISTTVTLPATDLTSTGLFEGINALTLTIAASQMSEL